MPPNITSLISIDLNTSELAAGDPATDYFQMIQDNDQMKDKYKSRIDEGEECQKNSKEALKGSTLTSRALYISGIAITGKGIW